MYDTLRLEIIKRGLRQVDIARALCCTPQTVTNKLNGQTEFNLRECVELKKMLNSNLPIDILFER